MPLQLLNSQASAVISSQSIRTNLQPVHLEPEELLLKLQHPVKPAVLVHPEAPLELRPQLQPPKHPSPAPSLSLVMRLKQGPPLPLSHLSSSPPLPDPLQLPEVLPALL